MLSLRMSRKSWALSLGRQQRGMTEVPQAKALLPEKGEVSPRGKGAWDRWDPCHHQETPWRKRGSLSGAWLSCDPAREGGQEGGSIAEGERQMGTWQAEVRSSGVSPSSALTFNKPGFPRLEILDSEAPGSMRQAFDICIC